MKLEVDTTGINLKIGKYIKEFADIPKKLAKELLDLSLNTFSDNNWEDKKDGSKATLIDTGKLKAGIKSSYDEQSAKVYNNVAYSSYHQFGTSNMPARPFIIDDKKIIEDIIKRLINNILK